MKKQKFHVRKGDLVQVIAGNQKGSEGKIVQLITKKSQVIVEGVRLIKKHVRRSQQDPNGGIIEREGPIQVSNVKLVARSAQHGVQKKAKA